MTIKIDRTYSAKAYLSLEKGNDTLKQFTFDGASLDPLIICTALLIIIIPLAFIIIIAILVICSEHKDWDKEVRKRIPLIFSLAAISPIMCIYMLIVSLCSVGYMHSTYTNHPLYKSGNSHNFAPIWIIALMNLLSEIYCIAIIIASLILSLNTTKNAGNKKGNESNNSTSQRAKGDTIVKMDGNSNTSTSTKSARSHESDRNTTSNSEHQHETTFNMENERVNISNSENEREITLNTETNVNAKPHLMRCPTLRTIPKKMTWYVLLSLIILGPILSIIAHSPYIAIAYLNDGYHAGSIFIYYTVVLCSGFTICWIGYHSLKVQGKSPKLSCEDKRCTICSIILGMTGAFAFLGLVVVVTVYFVIIPINKSISDAPNRLVEIYQSGGFLIASFVTYKLIAFFYKINRRSRIDKAIAKRTTPLKQEEEQATWDKSSEDKIDDFYEVIVQIIAQKNTTTKK